jgi:hypothetical protein
MNSGRGGNASSEAPQTVDEMIRALRVVWGGLLGGVLLFSGVIAFLGPLNKGEPSDLEIPLSIVLGMLALGCAVGGFVIRNAFIQKVRARAEALRRAPDPLLQLSAEYRGYFVVISGLTEGPALFALTAYLVCGMKASIVAVVVALALFLVNFPSESKARTLVQNAIETA